MTTITDTTSLPSSYYQSSSAVSSNTNEASDRFLTLLVTQMKNQDPLNPMDNAQVTSQMAQISTVSGIEKLNTSINAMSDGFSQLQLLQGVSLVGHQVLTEGNALNVTDGVGIAGFELSAAASSVTVSVKNSAGTVVDTIDVGAASAGRHGFEWTAPTTGLSDSYTFSVQAKSGNTAMVATPLSTDTVDAVNTRDGQLNLQLRHGSEVAYSQIKALS
jgi:flagellar basal-body rod modification protein FlgD